MKLKEEDWYSILEDMDTCELVKLYNDYASENCYEELWSFDECTFENLLSGKTPWDLFVIGVYASVNFCDDYFTFNGNGNVETMSDHRVREYILEDNLYDMVDWLNENKGDLVPYSFICEEEEEDDE